MLKSARYKKLTLSALLLFCLVGLLLVAAYKLNHRVSGKNSEIVVIAVSDDYEPFSFFEDGEMVGFDLDLISAIMEKAGKSFEFKVADRGTIVNMVADGNADIAISGLAEARTKDIRLTNIVYSALFVPSGSCMMQIKGSHAMDTGDKKRRFVGVIADSLEERFFSPPEGDRFESRLKYLPVQSISALAESVSGKKVDFGLVSSEDFTSSVKMDKAGAFQNLECVQIPSKTLSSLVRKYAIVVKKDSELAEVIDQSLMTMVNSGEYDAIRMRWLFGFSE